RVPLELIVHGGARAARALEAEADLDALDGLDGHERLREPAVQPGVPGDVAAEADGHAAGDDLEHAAEGVARGARLVHRLDHAGLGLDVKRAERRLVGGGVDVLGQRVGWAGLDGPERDHVAADGDAELREQPLGDGARGDARGGLAGGGALEDVARVAAAVLEDADEVRVAGPGQVDALELLLVHAGVRRLVGHGGLPVLPVAVPDQHRDGRAERLAEADAGEELGPVALDAHAAATAVAGLAAPQLGIDVALGEQREARRHALDQGDESTAVGITRGPEAETHASTSVQHVKSPTEAGLSKRATSRI